MSDYEDSFEDASSTPQSEAAESDLSHSSRNMTKSVGEMEGKAVPLPLALPNTVVTTPIVATPVLATPMLPLPVAPPLSTVTPVVAADPSASQASQSTDVLDEERKQAGKKASDQSEFKYLSNFVAFGSNAPSMRSSAQQASPSLKPNSVYYPFDSSVHNSSGNAHKVSLPFGSSLSSYHTPESQSQSQSTSEKAHPQEGHSSPLPTAPNALVSADNTKENATTTSNNNNNTNISEDKSNNKPSSHDDSSIFSTLSQNIKAGAAATSARGVTTFPSAGEITAHPRPEAMPRTAAPTPAAVHSPDPQSLTNAPAFTPPALATTVAPTKIIEMKLPELPTSALAPPSSTPLAFNPPRVEEPQKADPFRSTQAQSPHTQPSPSMPVQTMPSPLPAAPVEDPKIVELRETSAAVERLVKAFAALKGHNAPPPPPPAPLEPAVYETTRTQPVSKVGYDCTVRPTTSQTKRVPLSLRDLPANEKNAIQSNETLLEDAVMACVLDILQEGMGKATHPKTSTPKQRRATEVVLSDEFRMDGRGRAARTGRAAGGVGSVYSVFDDELRAFAPQDGDAEEALYTSVAASVSKYILSHVVEPSKELNLPKTSPLPVNPLSSHFAWTLLLDLVSLCEFILRDVFADGRNSQLPSAQFPVLVRYDGEQKYELLARNALHCLPFEALERNLPEQAGRSMFRMEYWVTPSHLHTIIAAVLDTLRDHVSNYAKELAYHPFAEEYRLQDAAETFSLPSKQRFFSLMPSHTHHSGAEEGGGGAARARPETAKAFRHRGAQLQLSTGDELSNYFNVSTDGLRALAHEVSTISTEIAAQNTAPRLVHDLSDYETLTRAVFDTMCELLDDSAIQEAVKRRALEKYQETQKNNVDFKKKSREDKEKQLIEKAEREAEQVVQRIMQEMHIKEAIH